MKNIEHTIKVNYPLYSSFHKFSIDIGAKFYLQELEQNPIMVKFLCQEFENNAYSIVGNTGELYRVRTEILRQERIGRMTYREYLEAKIRGEL